MPLVHPLLLFVIMTTFFSALFAEDKMCEDLYLDEMYNVVSHKDVINDAKLSPNGELLASGGWDGVVKLTNLKTGRIKSFSCAPMLRTIDFSNDGNSLLVACDSKSVKIIDLVTEKERLITYRDNVPSAYFSPDGKSILTASGSRSLKIVNQETGDVQSVEVGESTLKATYSSDGKFAVAMPTWGKTKVVKLETGIEKEIPFNGIITDIAASSDGNLIAFSSYNQSVQIYDLTKDTSRIIELSDVPDRINFSIDGKALDISFVETTMTMIIDTGEKRETKGAILSRGQEDKSFLIKGVSGNHLNLFSHPICLSFVPKEIKYNCADCTNEMSQQQINDSSNKLTQKILCELPSNSATKKIWKETLPNISNSFTEDKALAYLLSYQKAENFEPERDTAILSSIINSNLQKSHPELIAGALQSVMMKSFPLYNLFLKKFPHVSKMDNSRPSPCRTPDEVERFKKRSFEYLIWLKMKYPKESKMKN